MSDIDLSRVCELVAQGKGDVTIAEMFAVTRHAARKLIEQAKVELARREQRGELVVADPEPLTADEFAAAILGCWRKSVEAIFETGRMILRAKDVLPHGAFLGMIEEKLPFSANMAQKLMRIARHEWLSNASIWQHLPANWTTLHQLSGLEPNELDQALEAGSIHPEMTLNEVALLRAPDKPLDGEIIPPDTIADPAAAPPEGETREVSATVSRPAPSFAVAAPASAPPRSITDPAPVRTTPEGEGPPAAGYPRGSSPAAAVPPHQESGSEVMPSGPYEANPNSDTPPRPAQSELGGAEEQRGIIAQMDEKIVLKAAKELRAKRQSERREAKLADLRKIGAAGPLPSDKRYAVIYADPPWKFEVYSEETGREKSAENHYPTMSMQELLALAPDISKLAASDAVLFMWATVPLLPDQLTVMERWGFKYKSHMIWDKERIGTGYWFRIRHELLLVGTRGEMPGPDVGRQYHSLLSIRRSDHSAKPREFADMIEAMFPGVPAIELFARGPARKGWDVWGNEAALDQFPPLDMGHHPEAAESVRNAGSGQPAASPTRSGEMPDIPAILDRRKEQTESN